MQKIKIINDLLKHKDFTTKITLYFSTRSYPADYDSYEKNCTYTNLNPHTIKGYVTEISPGALIYRAYGLKEIGAKEVVCESKYREWFENCNKIEIDGDEYEIFKEGTGNRAQIQKRPYNLIRVILQKRT